MWNMHWMNAVGQTLGRFLAAGGADSFSDEGIAFTGLYWALVQHAGRFGAAVIVASHDVNGDLLR